MSFGNTNVNRRHAINDAYRACCSAMDRQQFMAAYTYFYFLRNNRNELEPGQTDPSWDGNSRPAVNDPAQMKSLEQYVRNNA